LAEATREKDYPKAKIGETYTYTDKNGNLIWQKARRPGKEFRCRKPSPDGESWLYKDLFPDGGPDPLYRLPRVAWAIETETAVFLVEGEKDVHTAESLGLVATTARHSSSFKPEWAEQLRGAHVVIIPDNDKPGRTYAEKAAVELAKTAKSLRVLDLPELGEKEDLTDWIEKRGGCVELLVDFALDAPDLLEEEEIEEEDTGGEKGKKKPKARQYEAYKELFEEVLGEIRRDIFTGELVHEVHGRWEMCRGLISLGVLKSAALDKAGFSAARVEPHLMRLTRETPRELLANIPEWDGGQRLAQIAQCVSCQNLEPQHVEELLKDWGSRVFERIYNPMQTNRCLILKGPQRIGKDWLITQMFQALKEWKIPFTFNTYQEKDNLEQISAGAIMHLEEFDRTYKSSDVAAIKHMITATSVRYRPSHGKLAETRDVRSSWVATCNVDGILRDPSGSERFIIFDVKSIDWGYPQGESEQILAELKALAQTKYRASEAAEAALDRYLETHTPEDPDDALCELFEVEWRAQAGTLPYWRDTTLRRSSEMQPIWEALGKATKRAPQTIKHVLKQRGYGGRMRGGIVYGGVPSAWQEEPEEEEGDTEFEDEKWNI